MELYEFNLLDFSFSFFKHDRHLERYIIAVDVEWNDVTILRFVVELQSDIAASQIAILRQYGIILVLQLMKREDWVD